MRLDITAILSCMPVDPMVIDGKTVSYTPPAGAVQAPCEMCRCRVWMGPKQQNKKTEEPTATVLCTICSIKAVLILNRGVDVAGLVEVTKDLGGQSGKYEVDGKHVTDPRDII